MLIGQRRGAGVAGSGGWVARGDGDDTGLFILHRHKAGMGEEPIERFARRITAAQSRSAHAAGDLRRENHGDAGLDGELPERFFRHVRREIEDALFGRSPPRRGDRECGHPRTEAPGRAPQEGAKKEKIQAGRTVGWVLGRRNVRPPARSTYRDERARPIKSPQPKYFFRSAPGLEHDPVGARALDGREHPGRDLSRPRGRDPAGPR